MTDNQKKVLGHFDAKNIGAIWFEGKYQFPVNVRESSELADRLAETIFSDTSDLSQFWSQSGYHGKP